ncbi:MAG: right-handed parallel beta-helix repeat-containing protein [Planctomycetota bacterium]|jgi:hypothetical protein
MKPQNKVVLCLLCLFIGCYSYSATYYVNDDAPNDPGPDDSTVSDPLEDGSQDHPFDEIQEAIDIVDVNDIVLVQTGTYYENLVFPGIDFVLTSSNPLDETVVSNTIVDGNDLGRVVTFAGTESPQCILTGLTIFNGYYRTFSPNDMGGGVFGNHTAATISHCIISENYIYAAGGGIAQCTGLIENCIIDNNHSGGAGAIYDCTGVIKNCTITNNHSYNEGMHSGSSGGTITSSNASIESCVISNNISAQGSTIIWHNGAIFNCVISGNSIVSSQGILVSRGAGISMCTGDIKNCTITGNRAANTPGIYDCSGVVENCIIISNVGNNPFFPQVESCPQIRYCCFMDGNDNGNFDTDPLFVQYGHWHDNFTPWDPSDDIWTEGDYHLKSGGWRWDAVSEQWISDALTSRCIDAGNPGMGLGEEFMSGEIDPGNVRGQNVRINMGAYGGTSEASLASPGWALLCDLDNSGNVSVDDFISMGELWLQTGAGQPTDVSRDGIVNLEDMGLLGQDWLETTTWH